MRWMPSSVLCMQLDIQNSSGIEPFEFNSLSEYTKPEQKRVTVDPENLSKVPGLL